MKHFDIPFSVLAIELAMRTARGGDVRPRTLCAEYGFSRATAYRWWKRLRDVQDNRSAPRRGSGQRQVA